MIPQCVAENVKDFRFAPDRQKAFGRMWGGSATAEIGETKIFLQLWHHGGDEETAESLVEHLKIQTINGKDAYWHCLWDENQIWIHEEGWFGFSERAKALEAKIPKVNSNFFPRTLPEEEMIKLGFARLV